MIIGLQEILLLISGVLAGLVAIYIFEGYRQRIKQSKMREALKGEVLGHILQLNLELDRHIQEWPTKKFTLNIDPSLYSTLIYDTYLPYLVDLLESEQMAQVLEFYHRVRTLNLLKRESSLDTQVYLIRVCRTEMFALGSFLLLGGSPKDILSLDFTLGNLKKYGYNPEEGFNKLHSHMAALKWLGALYKLALVAAVLLSSAYWVPEIANVLPFTLSEFCYFASTISLLLGSVAMFLAKVLLARSLRRTILTGGA